VTASAAHASLSVPGGTPLPAITGTGTTGTTNALAAFEAAVGGRDNGATAGEQAGGFRHLNWDPFAVDGSDPASRTIESGHVVGLGSGRLEPWGIEPGQGPLGTTQSQGIAVASDGFTSANPNVAGDFAPFSPPNVWAPYNANTAEFQIVAPAAPGSIPAPAQTQGFGVVLLNVTTSDSTVAYYNGDILLASVSAPVGARSFVGVLFPAPVVTRVVVTLGTATIFAFDGSSVTPTPPSTDFVAGDDVALAEPAPAKGAVTATAGVPVTAALDTFTETNPSATVRATIDWGDRTRTAGTITPNSGGTFVVSGDHAYAQTGSYTAQVTVEDFGGPEQTRQSDIAVGSRATAASVTCSPSSVAVSASTACAVTVSDITGGSPMAPAGLVSFASPTPGAAFPQNGACLLGPTAVAGVSACVVQVMPGRLPPRQARLTASYAGDAVHTGSDAATTVAVRPGRCSLHALTRKLRSSGLGILVTCDARAGVQIGVKAMVARKGRLKGFQLQFGTLQAAVAAGRPTVLVVKPARGVLPALRAALHRHQRVSLRLTLTASSHATTRTTTTRVSALR
jgi:hypothetical protein